MSHSRTPEEAADLVGAQLRDCHEVLVAVSGGVDSTVVAELATRELGGRARCVTADSPALKRADLAQVRELAAARGWRHEVVATAELSRPGYRDNGADRCFFCKTELFSLLRQLAEDQPARLVSGTNADDLGDYRPGLRAAHDFDVLAPLVAAKVGKREVRRLAHWLGLPTAERPASPCLASRIAYGTPVSEERLNQIERAESVLTNAGFSVSRFRVHGKLGRIEVPAEQIEQLVALRHELVARLRPLGFDHLTVDLEGFRSGSLNVSLPVLGRRTSQPEDEAR